MTSSVPSPGAPTPPDGGRCVELLTGARASVAKDASPSLLRALDALARAAQGDHR